MILSDKTLRALLDEPKDFVVPKPDDSRIQPVSLDLLLGNTFTATGPFRPEYFTSPTYRLNPGAFVLGATVEKVHVPNWLVGFVAGKSTWARRGLLVEAAGLVDPGFVGTITLELFNMSGRAITLHAGEAICQIYFCPTDVAVQRPYGSPGLNSHYQGQERAEPAR